MPNGGLLGALRDVGQGASNSVAATVSGPVDMLAWLLSKGGVPVPSNPMLGSEWMRQQGLTAEPQNKVAGLLGEAGGSVLPFYLAGKAPAIAENLARPVMRNAQAGNATIPFLGSAAAAGGAVAASDNPDLQAWLERLKANLAPGGKP